MSTYNETWQFECKFFRMQTCVLYGFASWNMHLIKHSAKGGKNDPDDVVLNLFCWLEFIHWVCFVLARAASLKIKLAKQINHMIRRLADCCCSFPPFIFIGIFSLLPSWSCSFLATRVPVDSTRCSRQHTSPLSASWNIHGQPGTAAQHRAAQTRAPLFINFITLPPGFLMHNIWTLRILCPVCFLIQSFTTFLFLFLDRIHKQVHIQGYIDGLLLVSLFSALFYDFALSVHTFIRQMGGVWMECWITDVCL